MDYRIIYIGAQTIFGILLLCLLFLRHIGYRGTRFDKLDVLIVLFWITTVLDCIWMLIDGRPEYRTGHIVLEVVYLSIMANTGYLWFLYTLDFFPAQSLRIRKYRFILGIPVIIFIVLVFASVQTSWMFVVGPDGTYSRGDLHIYMIMTNYLFMLLGSYVALQCRNQALLTIDKRRFTATAFFPIPPLILSFAQVILPPGLPAMQGGVLVALVLVYGTFQNSMVTRDYLTELPNRLDFEHDLLEHINSYRADEGMRLFLMEGDLNKFKQINDTHGHPAGDVVLKQVARALTDTFTPLNAAVFRTGGDEFMIIMESEEAPDVEALTQTLNARLADIGEPYGTTLTISLGLEEYDGSMDFRTLIDCVDKSLYAAKRDKPAMA